MAAKKEKGGLCADCSGPKMYREDPKTCEGDGCDQALGTGALKLCGPCSEKLDECAACRKPL